MTLHEKIMNLKADYLDANMKPSILYIDRDTFNEIDRPSLQAGVYRNVDGHRAYADMRIIIVEDFHWLSIGVAL